jgi:hypothetical protein
MQSWKGRVGNLSEYRYILFMTSRSVTSSFSPDMFIGGFSTNSPILAST